MHSSNPKTQKTINFSELMSRLLGLLSKKEQDVITRRFSLEGKQKETLDRIGKSYLITRERVRQIESVALKKLARISMDPLMRTIHDLAHSILMKNGKVMSEDLLVSEMLKNLTGTKPIATNSMKLAMQLSSKLTKQEGNQFFRPFWRTSDVSLPQVKKIIKEMQTAMKKKGNVIPADELASLCPSSSDAKTVFSLLEVEWGFMQTENGWGLKQWRFINPRSIRDKILITLKTQGKSMHFHEVVRHVLSEFKSKKEVTPQAVHNELIRHPEFVLVGRGEYGLKEWGMAEGTVADVIKQVFAESEHPLKRQEIIERVLQKREIRIGTISLNLQKYPCFKRVGRAVYEYDASLEIPKKKRGRGAPKKN